MAQSVNVDQKTMYVEIIENIPIFEVICRKKAWKGSDDVTKITPNFISSKIVVFQWYFTLKKWKFSLQQFICKSVRKIIYLVKLMNFDPYKKGVNVGIFFETQVNIFIRS